MESYKEGLFINETSHRFLSPPGSKGPIFQVGGLTRVDTVQLLFQNGLRLPFFFYFFIFFFKQPHRAASHHVPNHPALRNAEGNDCF